MRTVEYSEYKEHILAQLSRSGLEQFTERFDLGMILRGEDYEYGIVEGDLELEGQWSASVPHLLVSGSVRGQGFFDSRRRDQGDWDGGSIFVFGDIDCRALRLWFGSFLFVRGDLAAQECIITSYEDAGAAVLGDVRTTFLL